MGEVQQLMNLKWEDLLHLFLIIIIAIAAFQFLYSKWKWLWHDMLGAETKMSREEREQAEAIKTLQGGFEDIKNDQVELMAYVKELQKSVSCMQQKSDMNEAARLKDRIGQSYRFHHSTRTINSMEKETLKDLIEAYSQFSDNSFVHSIVEKEMETWEITDDFKDQNSM